MGERTRLLVGTTALAGGLAAVALGVVVAGAGSPDPQPSTSASSQSPSVGVGGSQAMQDPTLHVERLILTPATDPATSQTITWSQPVSDGVPSLTFAAQGDPPTSVRSVRRPATSVPFSGTAEPRYTATLVGLRPATTYTYWISGSPGVSEQHRFTTASRGIPPAGWRFLAFGDTQIENATTVKRIIDAASSDVPDAALAVQVGDVVNEPTDDDQWRDMFLAFGDLAPTRNWLVSIGNHEQCVLIDCESNDAEAFRSYFNWPDNGLPNQGPTWYSVDYQGVRFVVLDPFGGDFDEQTEFLKQRLAANPNPWTVVVEHAPPYAPRPKRPNPDVRERWGSLIERYDVDLVLSGHDHSYARGSLKPNGPVYVVSVSGPKFYPTSKDDWVGNGADLAAAAARTPTYQVITVDEQQMHYRAVVVDAAGDLPPTGPGDGEVLDEFTIRKGSGGKQVSSPERSGVAAS